MIGNIYKRFAKCLFKHIPGFRIRRLLVRCAGYQVGNGVYIGEDLIVIDELEDRNMVKIGDRASIAARVTLIVSSNPNLSRIGPFVKQLHGPIEIGEDAWIGTGSIIFPNTKIGKGAVVGAGSVVTRDVPDFTIAIGVPAKPLRRLNIEGV